MTAIVRCSVDASTDAFLHAASLSTVDKRGFVVIVFVAAADAGRRGREKSVCLTGAGDDEETEVTPVVGEIVYVVVVVTAGPTVACSHALCEKVGT